MNIFNKIDFNDIKKLLIETNKDNKIINLNYETIINYINNGSKNIIFLFIDNTKESILFFYELIKNNNVPVLLSPDLDEKFIKTLIDKYEPNFILTLSNLNIYKKDFKKVKKFTQYYLFEEKKRKEHHIYKDLCLLMSTSGTTGSPKLVKLSYESIYHNTKSICKFLKINNSDTTITTLQPHYTFGLSIINTHLYSRAKIIMNKSSFLEKNFWDKFSKYKINSFGGVSFMYEILKKIRFENMNLDNVKYITHAGGKLNSNLHRYILKICKEQNIKFITMYGQTEATSRISYLNSKYSQKKISSIGKAIPGGKMFFEKNKNEGEIYYKGKNIMNGYAYNLRDLSYKEDIKILKTGDYGWKDKDGFFYIKGRKDRFIKNFGHRINLDEIDSLLKDKGYTTATKYDGKFFKIFHNKNYNFDNIKKIISSKLYINKKYILEKKINIMPMTTSGKIKYSSLK